MAKQFLWNNGFTSSPSSSLSFGFVRDYATVDPGGVASAVDTPRYWHHNRLFCGANSPNQSDWSSIADGSFNIAAAGGVGLDSSTPVFLYFAADPGKLKIITVVSGSPTVFNVHQVDIVASGTGKKRGWADILYSSVDANSDYIYQPQSYEVCHGLLVAVCEVRVFVDEFSVSGAVTSYDPVNNLWKLTFSTPLSITPELAWARSIFIGSGGAEAIKEITSTYVIFAKGSNPGSSVSAYFSLWKSIGTNLCYAQVQTSDYSTNGWRRAGSGISLDSTSSPPQAGRPRGAYFQMQGYRILETGSDVTRVAIAFADYVLNGNGYNQGQSDYGCVYVAMPRRSATGQLWTFDDTSTPPVRLVSKVFTAPGTSISGIGQHSHTGYVEKYSSGMRVVMPFGDSTPNNRVNVIYRTDLNFMQGEASQTANATQNGWTTRLDRHGSRGALSDSYIYEGNQFVGAAQHGYPGAPTGQVVGGDETQVQLMRAYPVESSTDYEKYTRLFGTGGARINRQASTTPVNFNTFKVECLNPVVGGPFVAMVAAGNQDNWRDEFRASYYLYSPDGENWGRFLPANESSPISFAATGGKLLMGSQSSNPLRWVSLPQCTVQRPLLIGRGGTNSLSLSGPYSGSVVSPNTCEEFTPGNAAAEFGCPPPPWDSNVFFLRCPASSSSSSDLGIWKLTSGNINKNHKIKFTVWVYPLIIDLDDRRSAMALRLALGKYSDATSANPIAAMSSSREQFVLPQMPIVGDSIRGWFPVTLETDPQGVLSSSDKTWRSDGGVDASPLVDFVLGLRVRSRNGSTNDPPNPCDFLIAMGPLSIGSGLQEYFGIAIPQSTTKNSEKAKVSGFTCSSINWTIQLAGEVPEDGWDFTDDARPAAGSRTIATLYESDTKWIRIEIDATNNLIRLRDSSANTDVVQALPTTQSNGKPNPMTLAFTRCAQVMVAIAKVTTGSTNASYRIGVSVGGSKTQFNTMSLRAIAPTEIRLGDYEWSDVEPMLWYGGQIVEDSTLSEAEISEDFENLDVFFQRSTPLPPGAIQD